MTTHVLTTTPQEIARQGWEAVDSALLDLGLFFTVLADDGDTPIQVVVNGKALDSVDAAIAIRSAYVMGLTDHELCDWYVEHVDDNPSAGTTERVYNQARELMDKPAADKTKRAVADWLADNI